MTDTAMPLLTCPDCPAVADPDTRAVEHFDGCPVGRAIDEMTATDRRWFAAHPGADHYHRPLMPGDRATLTGAHQAPGADMAAALAGTSSLSAVGVGDVEAYNRDALDLLLLYLARTPTDEYADAGRG